MGDGQYNSQRRVTKAPAVERVSQFDNTAKLDMGRQRKFEEALTRAADSVRQAEERRQHRSYQDAERRKK